MSPAVSSAQYRFMRAGAPGSDMTQAQAEEYVSGQSPKGLPARAPKQRKKSAPLPAYNLPAGAAAGSGGQGSGDKAMKQTVSDIGALSGLRNRRLPAAGYGGT